jgi:hypothetical protein
VQLRQAVEKGAIGHPTLAPVVCLTRARCQRSAARRGLQRLHGTRCARAARASGEKQRQSGVSNVTRGTRVERVVRRTAARTVTAAVKRVLCCALRGRAAQMRSARLAEYVGAVACSCAARQPRGGAAACMLHAAAQREAAAFRSCCCDCAAAHDSGSARGVQGARLSRY